MAITGTLEILKNQTQNARILQAINFLENNNLAKVFETVSPGKNQVVDIDGKTIYAIFQEYKTKMLDDVKIEGHKKYIDVQYIFEGNEIILLASEKDIAWPDTYNAEKDVHFPKVKSYSLIQIRNTEAAILFPVDLHGPCCCINEPENVKKIVIKVAID